MNPMRSTTTLSLKNLACLNGSSRRAAAKIYVVGNNAQSEMMLLSTPELTFLDTRDSLFSDRPTVALINKIVLSELFFV